MASVVMADIVVPYVVMAYVVTAYVGMAYIVMAYVSPDAGPAAGARPMAWMALVSVVSLLRLMLKAMLMRGAPSRSSAVSPVGDTSCCIHEGKISSVPV